MFRTMRRSAQALSLERCQEILASRPRGVLSLNGEGGYPYGVPMNYIYLNGKLCFHSALEGHKVDALLADDRASFCVLGEGERREGDWALTIDSVIVFGHVAVIEDPARARETLLVLGRKYYPTVEAAETVTGKHFARVRMWEMTIDAISGKRVHEA